MRPFGGAERAVPQAVAYRRGGRCRCGRSGPPWPGARSRRRRLGRGAHAGRPSARGGRACRCGVGRVVEHGVARQPGGQGDLPRQVPAAPCRGRRRRRPRGSVSGNARASSDQVSGPDRPGRGAPPRQSRNSTGRHTGRDRTAAAPRSRRSPTGCRGRACLPGLGPVVGPGAPSTFLPPAAEQGVVDRDDHRGAPGTSRPRPAGPARARSVGRPAAAEKNRCAR